MILATAAFLGSCGGGEAGGWSSGGPAGAVTPANGAVTLQWDPVTPANLGGYRVYYGKASGAYTQPQGNGVQVNTATTSYTVTGLNGGTRYFFAVTAFDLSNNESGFSNEVFKDTP